MVGPLTELSNVQKTASTSARGGGGGRGTQQKLTNKKNTRRVFFSSLEHFSHAFLALAGDAANQLKSSEIQHRKAALPGECLADEGLAGARRSFQEDAQRL